MATTVYAYQVNEGGALNGFASLIEEVAETLRQVRSEIRLEDGYEPGTSAIFAFDLLKPDLGQLFAVLNGDAELADLILKDKRLVRHVTGDEEMGLTR
ncbi:hypothetical protein [Agrobacterium salinitolerans]|uniref:hypothetical protein n=1 Tax=Agrobacterium salinitolerans TaxID=1183413 RepID=UPI0022B83F9F|nr:hypothetical protein [Agrobacterium salinitolerans]MCZ7885403.1 hypothetical protein [Agrobacterium salinitolerans]